MCPAPAAPAPPPRQPPNRQMNRPVCGPVHWGCAWQWDADRQTRSCWSCRSPAHRHGATLTPPQRPRSLAAPGRSCCRRRWADHACRRCLSPQLECQPAGHSANGPAPQRPQRPGCRRRRRLRCRRQQYGLASHAPGCRASVRLEPTARRCVGRSESLSLGSLLPHALMGSGSCAQRRH